MRRSVVLFAAVVAAGPLVRALPAQIKATDTLFSVERYLDYETVNAPRISPDGNTVIFARRAVDKSKDSWESTLWIMNVDGTNLRFLAKGADPRWSPDGTRISFLAPGEPSGTQVFVRFMDAEGAISQVTRVDQPPTDVKWSPDGAWLGFAMVVPSGPSWSVKLPSAPPGATWTKAPRVVEKLHYRADGRGWLVDGYTHLFVVPATGGTPRQLTSGEWNIGARGIGLPGSVGWDWMPDGKSLVVEGNDDPDAERQRQVSNIYAVDLTTLERKRLTPTKGNWTSPAVSPDGKTIAFLGFEFTKQTYRVADLYTMPAGGGAATLKSQGFDRSPSGLTWAPDNSGIYFTADDRGTSNVHFAPSSGPIRQLTIGTHMLGGLSVSKKFVATAVRSHTQAPPDVVRLDLKKPAQLVQLTNVNADFLAGTKLGEVEEIWYRSSGGARVQGWIVKPPAFTPDRKWPLVLEIHGGPHGMYHVGFNPMYQNFAANGFVTLYTNPRGSTGYGTDFGNAIDKAYPSVDYDDLIAGVDSVVGRGYIDEKQMFVTGCSGGGVLTSWVIAHTDRFAAAAVLCPVTNWMSFAGTSDIPLFGFNWFEKPYWEDPMPWLKQSTLFHVGKVKTPTLLMTGELDLRTPMAQTEEYFAALKVRGIPTAMVRFEGEYHGTGSKPSNWMRTQIYLMEWFKRWSGGAPRADGR
ncbi:MAG: S9 family peptidase [Gemmatimonadales bacterium]